MKRPHRKRIDYSDWTVEQHEVHLRTHEPYLTQYAQYNSKSIDSFIKEYAKKKHELFLNREKYLESYETHRTQFINTAEEYIDMILQKKLFNLQCKWQAGLIDLPLIDISRDFEYMEKDIRNCPLIAPITPEEIELCIQFLNEEIDYSNGGSPPYSDSWQCYEEFKNQLLYDDYQDNVADGDMPVEFPKNIYCSDLPDFYLFFDTYQNTAGLLRLPDIRAQNERLYLKEGYRLKREQEVEADKASGKWVAPKPHDPNDDLPYLYSFSNELDTFIEASEDEGTKEVFNLYDNFMGKGHYSGRNESVTDAVYFLQEFNQDIAIEAASDWRDAIILTARRFKQQKIAEVLPYAYATYMLEFDEDKPIKQLIAERIERYKQTPIKDDDHDHQMNVMVKDIFLNGRESLTGRRDFDLLGEE